ncbi:hypothetical protein NLJ89_g5302 [Agrocybe chaxingu]|uniref:DUF4218 domain-containing protein n=1 Tax=Agrocybe chaxingu TaxID=84603 RepID=A0A9W8K1E2_9AGAR|nr:hypothetical protein NLJ89_g5302 [Agrocybe chaxingu]
MLFCTCPTCAKSPDIDPVTKAPLAGRYVSSGEFKKHQAQKDRLHKPEGSSLLKKSRASLKKEKQTEGPLGPLGPSTVPALQFASFPEAKVGETTTVEHVKDPLLMKRLMAINDKLDKAPLSSFSKSGFVFTTPPLRTSRPMKIPDATYLSLLDTVAVNAPLLAHERLLDTFGDVVSLALNTSRDDDAVHMGSMLASLIESQRLVLLKLKMGVWERYWKFALSKELILDGYEFTINVPLGSHLSKPLINSNPAILTCYFIIGAMHLNNGVSLDNCCFLLESLRLLLSLTSSCSPNVLMNTSPNCLPSDVETVLAHLHLQPTTRAYVCCPSCYELYPYDKDRPCGYPEKCTRRSTPKSSPCNATLRKPTGPKVPKPIRLYLHHEVDDWLGTLFSQRDIEISLDHDLKARSTNGLWDIWDAPELYSFLGPEQDPAHPFIYRTGREARLVFGLNMDGFNPFSNKEAGKIVTTGAIYMVCLNLPAAIRHDIENMFLVGVIPGPSHPSLDQINSLLRPLVDDLLSLWHHGVYLSSTSVYPQGRLVRGALIPVICDLPAARQISGFAGHSSLHQCSFCLLKADEIDNLDPSSWPTRSVEEHRHLAQEWLNAPMEKKRAEIFKDSGIRWHCRQIWGMDVKFEDGEFPSLDDDKPGRVSEVSMQKANDTLRNRPESELWKLPISALRELTRNLDGTPHGTPPHGYAKKALVKNLIAYRIYRGWFDAEDNRLVSAECSEPVVDEPKLQGTQSDKAPTHKQKGRRLCPPTAQEMELSEETLLTGSKTKLGKLRKMVLMQLCRLKKISFDEKECTVKILLELLEAWRLRHGVVDASGNLLKPKDGRRKKGTAVLGRETLKQVQADIERLQLPSWVTPAPSQPGVAKRGKFTADQWRSFCTYNLVFTLIRLWGSEKEESQRRGMLNNFLHLVTAVKLGSMRCMTEDRIWQYTEHIFVYLDTLHDLFKGTTLTPYQHLALHIPSRLRGFSPTHAWRCFTFERYNFVLQHIPTNMKFGELESTMFKRFCMGQNLRALFKPEEIPKSIHHIITLWDKVHSTDVRGTLRSDAFTFDRHYQEQPETKVWNDNEEQRLPTVWYVALRCWIQKHEPDSNSSLSHHALMKKKMDRLGEVYQPEAQSPPNSHVYYRDGEGKPAAGSIQAIFSHCRMDRDTTQKTDTFFILKQYQPLPARLEGYDPYRRYPLVAGRMFQKATYPEVIIVNSRSLLYHFAYGEVSMPQIDIPTIVAIPLDRC